MRRNIAQNDCLKTLLVLLEQGREDVLDHAGHTPALSSLRLGCGFARSLDPELFHPRAEGAGVDVEAIGSAALPSNAPATAPEDTQDMGALHCLNALRVGLVYACSQGLIYH